MSGGERGDRLVGDLGLFGERFLDYRPACDDVPIVERGDYLGQMTLFDEPSYVVDRNGLLFPGEQEHFSDNRGPSARP